MTMLTVDDRERPLSATESEKITAVHWLLIAGLLTTACFAAFGCSLWGYFFGDDAWHLPILYRAFHGETELLLKTLFGPFALRESLYIFYRPLSDLIFSIDYFLWKADPFGYHLGNLIAHAVSSIAVFVLSRSIIRYLVFDERTNASFDHTATWKIPLLVALCFAVYPCQTEPVCWVVARVDLVAAAFQFAAMTCAIEFFRSKNKLWFAGALTLLTAGLLTKEMCASVPFLLVFLFMVKKSGFLSAHTKEASWPWRQDLWQAIKMLSPMFAILAIYLVVRSLALHTIIGGYVGAAGYGLNTSFIQRLLGISHYWRLLHPVSQDIFDRNSAVEYILRALYLVSAILVVFNYKLTTCMKVRLKFVLIVAVLLLAMFLPVVQIWFISPGLVGTRLAYSFSFMLFFILAVLLYPLEQTSIAKKLRLGAYAIFSCLIATFVYISIKHSQSWNESTQKVNMIRQSIVKLVTTLPPNRKAVLINLPERISGPGAFFTVDFLPGLLRPPLSDKDISDRVISIDGNPLNSPLFNLARLKALIAAKLDYEFFLFDQKNVEFHRIEYPDMTELSTQADRPVKVIPAGTFKDYEWQPKVCKSAFTNKKTGDDLISYVIPLSPPINPLEYDVLELAITCRGPADPLQQKLRQLKGLFDDTNANRVTTREGNSGLLSWDTQTHAFEDAARPILFNIHNDPRHLVYSVNLTELKSWLLAGKISSLRLDLPKSDCTYDIESAVLRRGDYLAPKLTFEGSGRFNTVGLVEMSGPNTTFGFDLTSIPSATSGIVEVSKPYFDFSAQSYTYRDAKKNKTAALQIKVDSTKGTFTLPPEAVAAPAYYQVRICACDRDGNLLGTFSDPITIATIHGLP
ncbi:MAG: hypothetical protein K2X93_05150 [Candidatus Obscuribacterales bacterium]|nr:hypothetical protein [Candidatus Obscuribacterales bacterium]